MKETSGEEWFYVQVHVGGRGDNMTKEVRLLNKDI
jgi:hypothetical protein